MSANLLLAPRATEAVTLLAKGRTTTEVGRELGIVSGGSSSDEAQLDLPEALEHTTRKPYVRRDCWSQGDLAG